ncbi:ribosomal RNA small subunit methyltransferase nep-1 [Neltuma alba]|uniref:ribosomal RNA small subunit methyltransferase nep-1 n=1 Tax=Neltuma alba TaxID=207710 RepID=UPI0010A47134|nr:ribosomal RNA small subunit methyltransferase nep-1 [Prosopis alba]
MTRPYVVKDRKRKKKEKYDAEEDEEAEAMEVVKRANSNPLEEEKTAEEAQDAAAAEELEGIPIAPSDRNTDQSKVIFVLERASLEVAKVGKSYQILNSDDHSNFLRKHNRNPADYRPDIVHQALLMILDSPLNKAGRVKAVYVRTEKGVLFEVKPHVRIPRTFKRFSGVMLQLLQKLSITAVGKREKLLRVIKNPVTQHLPLDSRKISLSYSSQKLVDMNDYVTTIPTNMNPVFVVGAMAHGKIEPDYTDEFIAISGYPLSAAYCLTRICAALEGKWKIL